VGERGVEVDASCIWRCFGEVDPRDAVVDADLNRLPCSGGAIVTTFFVNCGSVLRAENRDEHSKQKNGDRARVTIGTDELWYEDAW
jgi:hypothetical protein